MEPRQHRPRRSAWMYWIGLSITIALTLGLAGVIIWLVVTQNPSQLSILVSLIASIVAIVSTPLIFYFAVFHKSEWMKTGEYWIKEGFRFYAQEQYNEALAALEQAISLDPNNTRAYRVKGKTLEKLNRPEEALEAYDKIREIERLPPPTSVKGL